MSRDLDDLECRVVAGIHSPICWQWYLRQANGARVGAVRGTQELKRRHHRVGHVQRTVVRPVDADADVDVKKCGLVSLEPAGLEGYRTTRCRPICPVCCQGNTTTYFQILVARMTSEATQRKMGGLGARAPLTWIFPLHAIRPIFIMVQIVSSPAGICNECMCRC